MTAAPQRASIAIVGAGPRGASLIERIGANLSSEFFPGETAPALRALDLYVIDDAPSGAGRIWREDQDRELVMNTLADAVTLFTEPGSSVEGPVREGPTLYEWCMLIRDGEASHLAIPASRRETFTSFPPRAALAESYRSELAETRPESHPTRALYGEYLRWCYDLAVSWLPESVRVIRHRSRAVGVEAAAGTADAILLADGTRVQADAIVLATGWVPRVPTTSERELTEQLRDRPELTWVPPASPIEQHFAAISAGEQVIVRGMGMGFFDAMALLTIGRGGEFVQDREAVGGLRYIASGREPTLHVTSRRGVPFRAKTLYGSLPPSPPQRYARGHDWDAEQRPLNFDRTLWPRVVADAHIDHFETLARVHPEAVRGSAADVSRAIDGALDEILRDPTGTATDTATDTATAPPSDRESARAELFLTAERIAASVAPFIPSPADRLDLVGEMQPVHQHFESPAEFAAWLQHRTAADLAEAELGFDSAVKAGLWSVSIARGIANTLGSFGGFDAESRESGFRLLTALGGMVGSGPPAFRNRQLLALAAAGIVRFIGPQAHVSLTEQGFAASSPDVAGSEVIGTALVDAWMHAHSLAETADPLTASLVSAGRARPFTAPARDGSRVATRAFDVDPATGLLIGAEGELDPSVHIAGIPVDEAAYGTIISPMPGTDPPMLRETDRVARSALRVANHTHERSPA